MTTIFNASNTSGLTFTSDTSGNVAIQSNGSNVISTAGSNVTFAGTLLNSSGKPILQQTGSILQVVNATYATQITSSSSTLADTGLTATITPTSATSKILVLVNLNGCGKDTGNTWLRTALLRGASIIINLGVFEGYTAGSGSAFFGNISTNYLDSPANTSAITYKIQFASVSNVATVYINTQQGGNNATSTMTLLESAA